MKYIIASDIHGSAFWCRELLDVFKRENADKLILLGDLLYHGPRNDFPRDYSPREVFAMLNSIKDKIICVRGNCDSEVDQMVLDFPILADYALLSVNGRTLFLTHGHLFNADTPPPLQSGDILCNGHFHTPCNREIAGGVIYANCGSLALPKDETPHSYIVIDKNTMYWYDMEAGGIFDCLEL